MWKEGVRKQHLDSIYEAEPGHVPGRRHVDVYKGQILFMLHDFEEIILLEAWQKSCKQDLKNKKLKRIIFSNCNNTPAFSIAVAIEFLLISLIALITTLTQNYYVWYAPVSYTHLISVYIMPEKKLSLKEIPCTIPTGIRGC